MKTKADYQIAREELRAMWAEHVKRNNLTVDIAGPIPHVQDDWPCMKYYVSVGGQSFEYKLGVGHAKMERFKGKEWNSCMLKYHLSGEEIIGLQAINNGRTLKDHKLTSSIACKVGRYVKTDPAEVIAAVCDEYHSADSAGDFESWASELGCDTDSRKAEAMYRQCLDGNGKLKRIGLSREQISKFAELHCQL